MKIFDSHLNYANKAFMIMQEGTSKAGAQKIIKSIKHKDLRDHMRQERKKVDKAIKEKIQRMDNFLRLHGMCVCEITQIKNK